MKAGKLEYFARRLKALEAEDREASERITDKLHTPLAETTDELSLYDNHPADIGDVTYERGKDLGFRLFWEDRLAMIREALEAIEDGTYGTCESCGREISLERLEAVPYTTLCQECKNREEALERHPRPIEEDVISPPFGGQNHDTSPLEGGEADDNNAFDGEDSWQAVARYGTSETPSDIGVPGIDDYDDVYIDSWDNIGTVEDYENMPVEKDTDGQLYKDFNGEDDEDSPFNWADK